MIRKIAQERFNTTGVKFIVLLWVLLSSSFFASLNAQDNKLLWRLGKVDNSSAEFSAYKTANPEAITIPSDWNTRTDWTGVSKGLKGSMNPSMNITFNLASIPANGVMMQFKLLDADKMVPEMTVFSNSIMAGMLQLYGTQRTTSPHEWKKTYQLYIPKELLVVGSNILGLEVNQQAWHGAGIKPYMVWEWDYLSLESLGQPATEPIHGKMSYLGTNITLYENGFDTNELTIGLAPNIFKWLGIAYSNNIVRANFYKNPWWNEIGDQSKRLEYLQLLKAYNMTVIGQAYSTLTVKQINEEPNPPIETKPDGTLGDIPKQILSDFFTNYGSYYQYHEVDNEPGLFNRTFRGNLAITKYINQIKPAHLKTTAPGWAYWPTGGDPAGWARNPVYRRQIEYLCQATNGHSYGRSYTDDQGGSFIENLETYGGVSDGWPKEYINTETGTEGGHTDFSEAGATQPHASIYDRIMRGHVSVVDRAVHHAAFFGWYGLFEHAEDWNDFNGIMAYPGVNGEDTRVKTFRRLALAYATHGAPLTYEHLNKAEIAGKKVYFRGVNTSTLAPLPGSGATANKILLNFVNFEGTAQTMKVKVTLPGCGTITGERIGAGNVYSDAVSSVNITASPDVELTVELGPRESVQYILEMPTGTCTINGGGQAPFGSGAANLPGIIEAANFDIGGEGVAYHDIDALNSGAKHRLGEGVDVYSTPTGNNYVSSVAGEWLEYTCNITEGTYNIDFNVSSTGASQLIVLIDEIAIDTLDVPNTGGDENWQKVSLQGVDLAVGFGKVLRLEVLGNVNIDNISIAAPATDMQSPMAITGLMASNATKTSVDLAWTASSDDVGITEYEIYNGTTLLGITSNTSYQANGLSTGINYTFTVIAKDAAGNSSVAVSVSSSTVDFDLPDLVITDITWSPSNPNPGQQVSIRAKVKNQGSSNLGAGTVLGISFVVNGLQVAWSDLFKDSIGVGQEVELTANGGSQVPTWTAGNVGGYKVSAHVDEVNRFLEANENNNYFEDSIQVYAPVTADLILLTSPLNNSVYEEGDSIKISATFVGTGVSKVIFLSDSMIIGEDNLAPFDLTFTNFSLGAHGITAKAIIAGDTIESGASVIIVNIPKPDLIVADITYSPVNPKANSQVVFTALIINIGKVATPKGTILGMSFWSNGYQTYADKYNRSLAAGDSVRIKATSGEGGKNYWIPPTAGNYTVSIMVDDYMNRIPEKNENNNWYQEDFCVLDPLGNGWNAVKLSTTTGPKVTPGSNIVLSSELSSCGTIAAVAKVEFYQELTKIGEDTEAPYTFMTQTDSNTKNYKFVAKAVDTNGVVSVSNTIVVTVVDPCINTTNVLLREIWSDMDGAVISDLTGNPDYPNFPSGSVKINSFEFNNGADNEGNKVSGILTPKVTGLYTFYIASDDAGELWLSTGNKPSDKVKIASVDGYTGWRQWTKYPTQESISVNLVAGGEYYIEALQKNAYGENTLNVGWKVPGTSSIAVIPGSVLSAYVSRNIAIVNPLNNAVLSADSLTVAANVSGCETITKVEFYAGTVKIGEDAAKPYQLLWKNIAVGDYMLSSRAISAVDTMVSSAINVTIAAFEPATSVIVGPATLTLGVNQSQQLIAMVLPTNATNKNVAWSSSNTEVVTVNASGVVTAIAVGLATITATTEDGGKTASSDISVIITEVKTPSSTSLMVKIYPIPATDAVNIEVNIDNGYVYIYSAIGEKMAEKKFVGKNTQIDISYLQSGLYIVEVRSEKATILKKLLVVR